jgi:hypothetical protein
MHLVALHQQDQTLVGLVHQTLVNNRQDARERTLMPRLFWTCWPATAPDATRSMPHKI